jgi:ribonuclease BN (tRNA processing enzyme)
LKLTILGAGTAIPYPNFSPAGYLVDIDGLPILLDAGPGTIARLAAHGTSYQELDFVLISHLHTDHALDLLTLLQANNATPGWSRSKELTLIGCQGIKEFLQKQFRLFDYTEPETYSLRFFEMGNENLEFDSWKVSSAISGHTSASLSYRITAGTKSMVYSGDACNLDALARLAEGADLLLCECSFPDGWETSDHLTPARIGELAKNARVKRIVLTHRYLPAIQTDVVSQVRAVYPVEVVAASDGWLTTL